MPIYMLTALCKPMQLFALHFVKKYSFALHLAQACFGYLGEEKGVPCFSPQYLTQNGKLQIKLAGEKTLTVRVENGVRSYKVD